MTDNCKHVSKIKTSIQLGILCPDKWHCHVCNTTESVWSCLSCSNFACGRYIAEHALHHFKSTGHPLCIEVNEKFVFCYICDDFVLNDNAPGDIKLLRMALDAVADQNFEELSKVKRGRRILRFHIRDAKKVARRLLKADDIQTAVMRHRVSRLSWALRLWWTRYVERKRVNGGVTRLRASSNKLRAPLTYSPAFTGLRNLGNTCYMNSVLQVLRHTAPFSNFVLNHPPSEILPNSKKRRTRSASTSRTETESNNKEQSFCATNVYSLPEASVHLSALSPSLTSRTAAPISVLANDCATVSSCLDDSKPVNDPASAVMVGGLNGGRCVVTGSDTSSTEVTPSTCSLEEPSVSYQGSIYEELYNLLQSLWSGQRTVISPSSLVYTIWAVLPLFKGYRQQDAQEFLSVFLDRLQSEVHGDTSTVQLNSRDFVNRTFQGYCVSHIRCTNCNAVACTEEPFSELSLALPPACYNGEASECDLLDLIRQFVSPTLIDGKSYACRECSGKYGCPSSFVSPCKPVSDVCSFKDGSFRGSASSTPCKVDKLVSVALSRLPTPSTGSTSPVSARLTFDPLPYIQSPASFTSNYMDNPADLRCRVEVDKLSTPCSPSCTPLSNPETPNPLVSILDNSPSSSGGRSCCLTSATQTIRLTRLPRVLRLHIKRFRWIGRQREKLGCHVAFPLILDLSDFMLNESDRLECARPHMHDVLPGGPSAAGDCPSPAAADSAPSAPTRPLYHLTGVIVHHGRGFQSGHYTAYCLNDQPECWLNCNDANVTLCDYAEVAASQAYLLFYSELMPVSPYPNWLNASDASSLQAHLKRCYSVAFTHPVSVTGVSQNIPQNCSTNTSATTVTKTGSSARHGMRLKRIASTPSHLTTDDSHAGQSTANHRGGVSSGSPIKPNSNRISRTRPLHLKPKCDQL